MMRKFKVTEEDKKLFKQATKLVKPLPEPNVVPKIRRLIKKNRLIFNKKVLNQQNNTLFYFSDHYVPILHDYDNCQYVRTGAERFLLKQLARGNFDPEICLDLHGLTVQQAKEELAYLLVACEKEQLAIACIITGHGKNILKRQLPNWLVQYPKTIAFSRATKEFGSNAALFVLLETEYNNFIE